MVCVKPTSWDVSRNLWSTQPGTPFLNEPIYLPMDMVRLMFVTWACNPLKMVMYCDKTTGLITYNYWMSYVFFCTGLCPEIAGIPLIIRQIEWTHAEKSAPVLLLVPHLWTALICAEIPWWRSMTERLKLSFSLRYSIVKMMQLIHIAQRIRCLILCLCQCNL